MEFVRNRVPWSRPLAALALLALLLPLAGPALARSGASNAPASGLEQLQQESKARAQVVKLASPAVVNIMVVKHAAENGEGTGQLPGPFNDPLFRKFFQDRIPAPPRNFQLHGLGSGIIVDAKGYVLTNNHVVAGADKITVKLPDGREFPGKVLGTDPPTDVAVVQIEGKDLPVARLGNSDEIDVGESVLAIGNPFGLEQTTTAGIVSAKGRNQMGIADYENFIQTDASINPGNSGGPLLNLKGEVIGINTAIYGNTGGNLGIGFAIPINQAKGIMGELIADGKVVRGYLGVVIQDLTPDLAGAMNLKPHEGVLVSSVAEGTPAREAGLRQGDVIASFQGHPVNSVGALRNAVAAVRPGTAVPAEVLRDGKRVTLTVKIAPQPKNLLASAQGEAGSLGGSPGDATPDVLGMTLQPLSPELASRMGVKDRDGVVITGVEDNSPAADAGLEQGMEIVEVNHHPVRTVNDVRAQVDPLPAKSHVLLLVRVNDANRFVAVQKS